jgi:cytosine/adenosine deaminase-related metal-dependent hydrolase
MLSLERRVLEPLLPSLHGLDILDLGCGTGRWLEILKDSRARSCVGIDFSREMLRHGHSKLGPAAKLIQADCTNLNLAEKSADLILCNFVLSYLADLGAFLKTASRLLRSGGSLFLTDLHPETTTSLHWRRGSSARHESSDIHTHAHSVGEILAACQEAGLRVVSFVEPRFGNEERAIFERNGKRTYFDQIRELPPIYILELAKAGSSIACESPAVVTATVLRGARFALGAHDTQLGDVRIAEGRIESLTSHGTGLNSKGRLSPGDGVSLEGYLLLPGLINAHDHLEFALFPRLGKGSYNNFLEWVDDIYHPDASPVAEHRRVPREVRLWWGGIRNLLCGVTTVCHHNPFEPETFTNAFPVRVLRAYGWAHSVPLDSEFAQKKRATPVDQPFFIHLCEGIDDRARYEIYRLHREGALDSNTVIVHGLGMDAKGRAVLRASQAALVWCPSSNLFLFGRTFSFDELRKFPRVALGSDSPITSAGDLLDEIRCAHHLLRASPAELYQYVTRRSANILRLPDGEGNIRAGAVADLVAVRDTGLSPAETLATLSYREIELVLLAGRVQLASSELKNRLPDDAVKDLQALSVEGAVRWVRAPLNRLFREASAHLGSEVRVGGKEVRLAH